MNLTGEENVRFHAVLYDLYQYRPMYRMMPAAYRHQIRDLADVVGLGAEVFKPVRRLSGGMRRKLEIIRGLMHHPKVLFLDEPTSGSTPRAVATCGSTSAICVGGTTSPSA
jgi:ABC-2 type transport system ATP-binding protein